MFQQYPQNDVSGPILLHEGRFRVRAGDRCIEPALFMSPRQRR